MIFKRKIAEKIIKFLPLEEIIVLHGARQVGKTHILYWLKSYLEEQAEKTYYIDLEDSRYKKILDQGPAEFIKLLAEEGYSGQDKRRIFVFIDEIQYLDNPSEFLKLIADHHRQIKLIVSGSSSFEIKSKFRDSLAGRTVNFEIFNLSFSEFLLFRGQHFDPAQALTLKKQEELKGFYREYALYGGYPRITLTAELEVKERRLQQIIDTYVRKDIRELADIADIGLFNKLLEALAGQSGQMLNVSELANTCRLSVPTVNRYLFILEQTYIIRLVRPFHRNLRSEIFKTPKIFFYDTGLMQMLWLKQLQSQIIGPVFEGSIFAELAKRYGPDNVNYWRTKDGKEVDFILHRQNEVLPIEAKLNFRRSSRQNPDFFANKYASPDFLIAGLEGERQEHGVYPWEL